MASDSFLNLMRSPLGTASASKGAGGWPEMKHRVIVELMGCSKKEAFPVVHATGTQALPN